MMTSTPTGGGTEAPLSPIPPTVPGRRVRKAKTSEKTAPNCSNKDWDTRNARVRGRRRAPVDTTREGTSKLRGCLAGQGEVRLRLCPSAFPAATLAIVRSGARPAQIKETPLETFPYRLGRSRSPRSKDETRSVGDVPLFLCLDTNRGEYPRKNACFSGRAANRI
ncbi:hypothetical protein VUR80DRAFT_3371 [Thermomyces stellatus]